MPIKDSISGYNLLTLESNKDWDFLLATYRSKYRGEHVFTHFIDLAKRIGCKTILIEDKYIDSCYRDQHSFLYSKAFKEYSTYCTRLHLFSIDYKKIDEIKNKEPAHSGYLGYIVVSPLDVGKVGRTVICPPVIDLNRYYYLCATSFNTHIFGKEFSVSGMPFIQQDTMVMRCAQASIWMALRFMKAKYDLYSPLPSEITLSATKYLSSSGRIAPSEGLVANQILNALSSLGYSPIFYNEEGIKQVPGQEWDPVKLIYKYIESQIPVLAMVQNHVITIIGHVFNPKKPECFKDSNVISNHGQPESSKKPIIFTSDLWTSAFIIHDDEMGPYRILPTSTEVAGGFDKDGVKDLLPLSNAEFPYKTAVNSIKSIIVPLPPKVYLSATYIDGPVKDLITTPEFLRHVEHVAVKGNKAAMEYYSSIQPGTINPLVLRSYIILSEKYKKKLDTAPLQVGMSNEIREQYKKMRMPRFIWITEITNVERLSQEKEEDRTILGEVILDATATRYGPAWLSLHLPGILLIKDPTAPSGKEEYIPTVILNDKPYSHHSRKL